MKAGPGYGAKWIRKYDTYSAWYKTDSSQQQLVSGTFPTREAAVSAARQAWADFWEPRMLANKWLTSPRIQA